MPQTAASGLPRLHLQDGPIDLVIMAEGGTDAVEQAYRAAQARFVTVLDELCAELPLLRQGVTPETARPTGMIACRMRAAVEPLAVYGFITPMAAVAGAVAEEILAAMLEAGPLDRAAVNNGGDIALHLSPGRSLAIGMVTKPELGGIDLFGRFTLTHEDTARGLATSGRHGRSFSLGIADAVTVLARTAAMADAAATVIANAVDLPHHPLVQRLPANRIQPDSDLGDSLVTRDVGVLSLAEKTEALAGGVAMADRLCAEGLIERAALHLQGETCVTRETNHG
ncbi:UPF0280 family protein [Acidisoma cellulosilytica]|uniref:UPF0280 family protein n=2 Tax=Acidisoma cellulosilyticum TaxID=2802395 RepID=A0A964E1Z8_9PROT|nr:UPF0280 family protein [Acidisoma cellulosilyticum]